MEFSNYMGIFLEEGREALERANDLMVKLEQSPEDLELVHDLFRTLHSFKGMASTMGFEALADLAHAIESLLAALREGAIQLQPGLVDAVLHALDALERMIEAAERGEGEAPDVRLLSAELAAWQVHTRTVPAAQEPRAEAPPRTPAAGDRLYRVTVRLDPACLMKTVQALMISSALETVGHVERITPPIEELEWAEPGDSFEVLLTSAAEAEAIGAAVADLPEVAELRVEEMAAERRVSAAPPTVLSRTVPAAEAAPGDVKATATIRVSADRLDALMALATELLGERERLLAIAEALDHPELTAASARLGDVAERLNDEAIHMRMVHVDTLFKRFPRMVRDLARELGKDVRLEVLGGTTEIDRRYSEALGDVLMHLIRNAVDHGLEPPTDRLAAGKLPEGTITLAAAQAGQEVVLTVRDDGRGLDFARILAKGLELGMVCHGEPIGEPELLELIFAPGFSTASATTAVSGRGVGMDAVRERVQALGGAIGVETRPDKGTTFTIRLPLGIAVVPAMLADVGGEVYGIPTAAIEAVVPAAEEAGPELTLEGGDRVPLVRLRDRFDVPATAIPGPRSVVVVRSAQNRVGLLVEHLIGEREVAVKPLSHHLGDLPGLSGAAPLGDGRIAFLVDPAKL